MFRTIKSRFFIVSFTVLLVTFILTILISFGFMEYNLYKNINNSSSYYYKFENFSDIERTIKYNQYTENNFQSENDLIQNYFTNFIYQFIVFIIFLFIIMFIIFAILYNKVYEFALFPLLNIEKSTAQEFIDINKNIKRKDKKISNQKEDLYKINKYITHEFKNSLMALKGKIYTDKEEAIEYVDEINKQIDDLNALTTDKVDIVDVDFLIICAEVIDTFDKYIDFKFSEDDFEIKGNTTLIYRVLYNIIENAFKYGGEEVAVKVDVKKIEGNVVCKISNNGPKLDETKLDNIFKLNYRINKLNKNGSGIGLSLVKNVMDILGGSLFVKSDYGNTTFYLSFIAKK